MARPAHRPTKFTPDAIETFLTNRRIGLTKRDSSLLADWSESLGLFFLARGHEAQEKLDAGGTLTPKEQGFLDFLNAEAKAEAQFKQAALGRIQLAAQRPQHWQANAWLLERRFGREFARPDVVVVGPDGGPVQIEVTAEQLLSEIKAMRQGANGHRALPPAVSADGEIIDVDAEEG